MFSKFLENDGRGIEMEKGKHPCFNRGYNAKGPSRGARFRPPSVGVPRCGGGA